MNKTSIEWTHRPETGGEAGGFTWNPIRAKAAVPNGHTGWHVLHAHFAGMFALLRLHHQQAIRQRAGVHRAQLGESGILH